MPMNEEPKWYILHTYSGYEAMVKDSLEKLIENNNLGDYIVDLKIPMEQVVEEKNGKLKVVERKLLPCYVFIKLVYSSQLWFMLTNTRGVTGFVGPQGKALPLTEDEVKRMRLDTWVEEVDFVKGENTVLATQGRHDPCIVHRARVVQDAATAIVMCDALATRFGTDWLK